jgi:glycine C-acetyltransferase
MLKEGDHLRTKMWENTQNLRKGLKNAGLKIGEGLSPITPVYMEGSLTEARNILIDIRENHHIFCSGVIYPVVPKGVILFRLVSTYNHTPEDIHQTIEAFKIISDNIKKGSYL